MKEKISLTAVAIFLILLSSGLQAQTKPLAAFGYDIFREAKEQIVEGPVDEQYILSPGDEIIITLWGQVNQRYPLTVSEDGFIEIPDGGGRIFTNGVSFKELRAMVMRNLAGIYAAYINIANPSQSTAYVDIKLGKLRRLLVFVVGEVKNQGTYAISSGVATLINLLNNAGGVKETGSLREIKIRRADGTVDTVDLYEFLITGKIDTKKIQVRAGDYIIVPLKTKSVSIQGEIKRSGIYEAVGNEGLKDLIRFAGGLTSNAYLKRTQVRRFEVNAGEKFLDLNLDAIFNGGKPDFVLADGDEVSVFPNVLVRRPFVEIQGSGVKRSGVYQYTPGMTVKDLIEEAEGLKEDVFLARADLVRTMEDFSKKLTIFSLQDLFKLDPAGQYVFSGTADKNFPLKELDIVMTYSSFEMKGRDKKVTLEGQVKEPGTYILPDNMTLYDLIFARGGFQDEEYKKTAYLDLAHIFRKRAGEISVQLIPFNLGKVLAGVPADNLKLEGGDRIVVYAYETMKTKPYVEIAGLVKRPGLFDLAENMTLEDLILVAGGLRPDAYKVEAVIGRTTKGSAGGGNQAEVKKEATLIVPVDKDYALLAREKRTKLESYDKIFIRNLPEWEPLAVVSLEGQLVYPGSYSLESKEERISNIIRRAGGVKKDGFPEGGILFRRKAILEMSPGGQIESEKVAINLKDALDNPGGSNDLLLRDGDRIFVPLNPGTVEVKGAVKNPAIFQYKKGKNLRYYVDLSGGYIKESDKSGVAVYHPNGMAALSGFLSGPEILPGSMISVPFKTEGKEIELVEVRGAVKNPTMIQFRKGEKLKYYVDLCGGYREDADLANIVVNLGDGKILESGGTTIFNPYLTAGSIAEVAFKVKETKTEAGKKSAKPYEDLKLKGGDVEVRGAVANPGLIRYRTEAKLEYYIAFCGGFKENADQDKIIVHMPDGKIIEKSGTQKAAAERQLQEGWIIPEIVPGCIIEIPFKEIKKEEIKKSPEKTVAGS
jgi:polysaccharide biosynthesis/export protein